MKYTWSFHTWLAALPICGRKRKIRVRNVFSSSKDPKEVFVFRQPWKLTLSPSYSLLSFSLFSCLSHLNFLYSFIDFFTDLYVQIVMSLSTRSCGDKKYLLLNPVFLIVCLCCGILSKQFSLVFLVMFVFWGWQVLRREACMLELKSILFLKIILECQKDRLCYSRLFGDSVL